MNVSTRESALAIPKEKRIPAPLWMFFLILPHLRPDFLALYPLVNLAFTLLRGLSVAVVIWMAIVRKPSAFSVLMLLWQGWLLLSTFLSGGDLLYGINQGVSLVGFVLCIDMLSRDMASLLKALLPLFEILIYLNLLTQLLFPAGLYASQTTANNWLLGYDNNHVAFFLPGLCVAFCYGRFYGKWKRAVFLTLAVCASMALTRSATAMVGMALFFLFALPPTLIRRQKGPGLRYWQVAAVALFVFFVLVVLRKQAWFSRLLVDLLGKDLTMTHRTKLWDTTLYYIRQKPLVGWGYQSVATRHVQYNSVSILSAHNQYLEFLYVGGLVGIGFFLGANVLLGRRLQKGGRSYYAKLFCAALLSIYIMWMAEVYLHPVLYLPFVLAYHLKSLEKGRISDEKEGKTIVG